MRVNCMGLHIIPRILAATYLLCGNAMSSTAQLANETRAEIEATSRALIAAQLRYDAPAVARLLTKDFVYVGHDGSFTGKSGFLPTADDRKRRPLELLEWKLKQVQFYAIPPLPCTWFTKRTSAMESHTSFKVVPLLHGSSERGTGYARRFTIDLLGSRKRPNQPPQPTASDAVVLFDVQRSECIQ
jgi:hypothetical protein